MTLLSIVVYNIPKLEIQAASKRKAAVFDTILTTLEIVALFLTAVYIAYQIGKSNGANEVYIAQAKASLKRIEERNANGKAA